MKIRLPGAENGRWYYGDHLVEVDADGIVSSHPDVIEMYAENLPHLVEVIEDPPQESSEGVDVDEPVPEITEAAESENETVSLEDMSEEELRALAKENGVRLGRTKSLDKIIKKLRDAGV
jgi:hypothetical protein